MITGDSTIAAASIGVAVELDPHAIILAACTVEQKAAIVGAAAKLAVFVGDGFEYALALAAADCGISVQDDRGVALATAVIASGEFGVIAAAWRHAMRTVRIVRQNLAFSVIYDSSAAAIGCIGSDVAGYCSCGNAGQQRDSCYQRLTPVIFPRKRTLAV